MTIEIPSVRPAQQPARRPTPGPASIRPIWDGDADVNPASFTPPPEPEPQYTPSRWTKNAAFGPLTRPERLTGLDAARGFALLGMVAVHTLPAYNESTDGPTIVWTLFAGHAAVLFGVLAGVTIALLTGGKTPHTGRTLRRSKISLSIRALLIFLLGLGLSQFNPEVYNILPFYGLLFLLAVPLVSLRIRGLIASGTLFVVGGPVLIFLTNQWNGYTALDNPSFSSLVAMPTDTAITLFVGGAYPAVTWMTYICLGMAIGRTNLSSSMTQVRLLVCGGVLAAVGLGVSTWLIDYAGGFSRLYQLTAGLDTEDIQEVLTYGPEGHLPTDTWWWLAAPGPHTNTPFSILASAGLAVFVIATFLVITRLLRYSFTPLIAAGSMTLTLYTFHVLYLTYLGENVALHSTMYFVGQVAALLLFATAWSLAHGRGPLEELVTGICRACSRRLVPENKGVA